MMIEPPAPPALYIFDLDGTLRSCQHRLPILDLKVPNKWEQFFLACDKDEPIPTVIDTLNRLLTSGADIWFFSGCGDIARQLTIDWLVTNTLIKRDQLTEKTLRMRPASQMHVPDYVVKKGWLEAMDPMDRKRLVAVFEDRNSVVAMWRREGVTCFQAAEGDF